MKLHRLQKIAALVLTAAIVMVGCAPLGVAGEDDAQTPTPSVDLDGTQWSLVEINGEPVVADGEATLDFADGQLGGIAFCNSFGAPYEVDGDALTIGELVQTLMLCADMGPETEYLTALATVTGYRIEGERLVLTNAEGDAVLTFVPAEHASLEGTLWELTGIQMESEFDMGLSVTSVVLGSEITATFDEGDVVGTAGCNSYSAPYTLDGSGLTIGAAISTKMFCAEPEGVMEQETAYLTLLSSVASFEIDRSSLTLFDADGAVLLTFVAAGE